MMEIQKKSAPSTDKHDRRRGRPAGKNRTPLSLEERRARNAQYERERRNETADAMAQLAESACCDPQIANAELLATVVSQLQRRANKKLPQDIEDLRRTNENLESQIADLESRLGQDIDIYSIENVDNCGPQEQCKTSESSFQVKETTKTKSKTKGRKRNGESDFQTRQNEIQRSKKICKTSKSSSVREKIASGSDSYTDFDSSSNSDWSASVNPEPTQYKLRNRSQKVSEQSEHTSYSYGTSESSNCGTMQSLNSDEIKPEEIKSNQTDAPKHPVNLSNNTALTAIPESEAFLHYDDETALLETLTEEENRIINEWLDGSETLNATPDHDDDRVLRFLDFDDFLLDISA